MTAAQWGKLLRPLALLALGLWLIVGCIYVPMFGRTIQGTNAGNVVGGANSSRPIRIHRTTRDEVVRILGRPYAHREDNSALAYVWTVQNGFTVWPLCFAGYSVDGRRTLVLRFDQGGVLQSTEILKSNDGVIQMGQASIRHVPLPPDFYELTPKELASPASRQPRPQGPTYRTEPSK